MSEKTQKRSKKRSRKKRKRGKKVIPAREKRKPNMTASKSTAMTASKEQDGRNKT